MTSCKVLDPSGEAQAPSAQSEIILRVEGVRKKFAYSVNDTMRYGTFRIFRELLGMRIDTEHLRPGEFWALDDVSFDLKRGETLGVIGSNGAGKSTLLKLISGVFLPDRGRIAIRGTVGGLIEIGAGFQPKLSGRDNIYIIGSVLGFSRRQISDMMDDIIEFADLAQFIDSPVQTYSSGMQVRLGFAIHVFQRPDILVADEVLAVGDFEFQQKCLAKINEIRQDLGMILVSHSMPAIVRFCDRTIVLDKGKVAFDGKPSEAVRHFTSSVLTSKSRSALTPGSNTDRGFENEVESADATNATGAGSSFSNVLFGPQYWNSQKIADVSHRWVFGDHGQSEVSESFAKAVLSFSFRVRIDNPSLVIGVPVYTLEGQMITSFNTDAVGFTVPVSPEGLVSGTLTIPRLSLNPGRYVTVLAVVDRGTEYLYRQVIGPLNVIPGGNGLDEQTVFFGVYSERHDWCFE